MSSFVYDTTGLKDMIERDSNSLDVIISKFIDFNNFSEFTLHIFATSNTTNVNYGSNSNSDIFIESPFKHSFPTTKSRSRKSQQRQSAVTIIETSSVNNVNCQGISTLFKHFCFCSMYKTSG